MCAVIGVFVKYPSEELFKKIQNIFIESKIRGMHATGISFLNKQGTISTIKKPISAVEFVKNHIVSLENFISNFGEIRLIGHCRYSTSDLIFNQPIENKKISLVHNGVISQELFENWEHLYKLKCEGKNDSELLLKTVEKNISPFSYWNNSSISAIELHENTNIKFYRNGKRPLYYGYFNDAIFITSTKDILQRVGIVNITQTAPFVYYTINSSGELVIDVENLSNIKDLQNA